jgi:hypothetical protein
MRDNTMTTLNIKHLLGLMLIASLTACSEFVEDQGQCDETYELDQYASLEYGSGELFVDTDALRNGVYLTALVKLPTGSTVTLNLESPAGIIGTTTIKIFARTTATNSALLYPAGSTMYHRS